MSLFTLPADLRDAMQDDSAINVSTAAHVCGLLAADARYVAADLEAKRRQVMEGIKVSIRESYDSVSAKPMSETAADAAARADRSYVAYLEQINAANHKRDVLDATHRSLHQRAGLLDSKLEYSHA
jgi:hypothetical protein